MSEASRGVPATTEGMWAVGQHAKPGTSPRGLISSLCCNKEDAQRLASYWHENGLAVDVWPIMANVALNFDTGYISITCENAYEYSTSDDFVVGRTGAMKV